MSEKPLEEHPGWARNAAGLYVPPASAQEHVERAAFAVKVRGFAPAAEETAQREGGLRAGRRAAEGRDPRPRTGA